MRRIRQILAITRMMTLCAVRSWVMYIALCIYPAGYFIMLTLIGGRELGQHVLYGFLISVTLNAGVVALPQRVVYYKQTRKLQDMFVSAPISPMIYMTGLALSRLMWATPGIIISLGIMLAGGFMPVTALPLTFVIVVATWMMGSTIGFTLGSYVANPHIIGTISSVLGQTLIMFPPVLYPIHYVPEGYRWLALLLPSASAGEMLRIAGGVSESGLAPLWPWLSLAVWMTLLWLMVLRGSQWEDR